MPNQSFECLLSRDQQAFTCGGARGLKCADERTRSRGMGARVAVGAFFDEVMRGSA
jgi:hypothetical protein